jgi:hypothetical protein
MLPPKSWRLPEYHTSMTSPLRLIVFSRHQEQENCGGGMPAIVHSAVPDASREWPFGSCDARGEQ